MRHINHLKLNLICVFLDVIHVTQVLREYHTLSSSFGGCNGKLWKRTPSISQSWGDQSKLVANSKYSITENAYEVPVEARQASSINGYLFSLPQTWKSQAFPNTNWF